jgi:hypothetical protein
VGVVLGLLVFGLGLVLVVLGVLGLGELLFPFL